MFACLYLFASLFVCIVVHVSLGSQGLIQCFVHGGCWTRSEWHEAGAVENAFEVACKQAASRYARPTIVASIVSVENASIQYSDTGLGTTAAVPSPVSELPQPQPGVTSMVTILGIQSTDRDRKDTNHITEIIEWP